jgi:hypothetical protein
MGHGWIYSQSSSIWMRRDDAKPEVLFSLGFCSQGPRENVTALSCAACVFLVCLAHLSVPGRPTLALTGGASVNVEPEYSCARVLSLMR